VKKTRCEVFIRGGAVLCFALVFSGCGEAEKPNVVSNPTEGVSTTDMDVIKQILTQAGHTEPIVSVVDAGTQWAVSLEPKASETKDAAGTLEIGTLVPPKNLTIDKATKKIVGSL